MFVFSPFPPPPCAVGRIVNQEFEDPSEPIYTLLKPQPPPPKRHTTFAGADDGGQAAASSSDPPEPIYAEVDGGEHYMRVLSMSADAAGTPVDA